MFASGFRDDIAVLDHFGDSPMTLHSFQFVIRGAGLGVRSNREHYAECESDEGKRRVLAHLGSFQVVHQN